MTPAAYAKIAAEAALAAGAVLRERFHKGFSVRHKGRVDLITEADLESERAVRAVLANRTPGAAVLGEEEGLSGTDEGLCWIVDPLDGTTNFAHALPIFCASVALRLEGRIVAGAVYDPMRDELFLASLDEPATVNGAPCRVSTNARLIDSLLGTGFAYDRDDPRHNFAAFEALTRASHGVRRLGAAALDLAYVAAGRLDGFWEMALKPWDTAAGALLVERAGGRVTALDGAAFDPRIPDIAASNGLIHEAMRTLAVERIDAVSGGTTG